MKIKNPETKTSQESQKKNTLKSYLAKGLTIVAIGSALNSCNMIRNEQANSTQRIGKTDKHILHYNGFDIIEMPNGDNKIIIKSSSIKLEADPTRLNAIIITDNDGNKRGTANESAKYIIEYQKEEKIDSAKTK